MEIQRELLHKYFRGETTPEEEIQIMDWAEASPGNYTRYLDERRKWNVLLIQHAIQRPVTKKGSFNLYRFIQYAAMIAIALSIGVYYLSKDKTNLTISVQNVQEPTLILGNSETIALNKGSFDIQKENTQIKNDDKKNRLSYQTQGELPENKTHHLLIPHGQTYQIELSDGTVVTLNAESELIFPSRFETNQRHVKLKGEGFFQVAKDKNRPFIVETEQLDVRVLGTTFNVSCYNNEPVVRTTLVEGSVRIEQADITEILHPSEQYYYNKQTKRSGIGTVDTQMYTSWIQNEYLFRNATLEEVFMQLAHWYKFDIHYDNPNLKNNHFSFKVSRDMTLDQIITLINNTEQVFIERTNHTIHIKNKRDHE